MFVRVMEACWQQVAKIQMSTFLTKGNLILSKPWLAFMKVKENFGLIRAFTLASHNLKVGFNVFDGIDMLASVSWEGKITLWDFRAGKVLHATSGGVKFCHFIICCNINLLGNMSVCFIWAETRFERFNEKDSVSRNWLEKAHHYLMSLNGCKFFGVTT